MTRFLNLIFIAIALILGITNNTACGWSARDISCTTCGGGDEYPQPCTPDVQEALDECPEFAEYVLDYCTSQGLSATSVNCSEWSFTCGDGSGDGDTYIYNNTTNVTYNVTNYGDTINNYYGDGGDTGDGGGDDTGEPVDNDEVGTWGCIRLYDSAVQSYIANYGTPAGLELDDYDSDGVVDQVWMNPGQVLTFEDYGFVDLDGDGYPDASDWTCGSWADGTDDDVDDDGDGWTENEGDLDDRSRYNHPGLSIGDSGMVFGDLLANNFDNSRWEYEGASDEDGDGYTELEDDCDDSTSTFSPDAYEWDTSYDYDCDGEDGDQSDGDGDGYCASGGYDSDGNGQCDEDEPNSSANIDCNDSRADVNPGQPEVGNWMDDNCDGDVDEYCDGTCAGAYDTDADPSTFECTDDYIWWYEYGEDESYQTVCTP